MTPREIKDNAPEGATHYRSSMGFVFYYKDTFHPELWQAWSAFGDCWEPIFGKPYFIKPL